MRIRLTIGVFALLVAATYVCHDRMALPLLILAGTVVLAGSLRVIAGFRKR